MIGRDGQTCPSRFHLRQSVFFDSVSDCVYLNNAKAGCSTIRAALIRAIADRDGIAVEKPLSPKTIHGSDAFWSANFQNISPGRTFCFSLVRNPFTRILSAYLDKICRPGILRNQFCIQTGLDPKAPISFPEFLGALDPQTQLFDQHWRPQVSNLFVTAIDIDAVYHLETFAATQNHLASQLALDVQFSARDTHATGASDRLDKHLTPEAIDLIRQLYKDDFEVFGYSSDPDRIGDAPDQPIRLPANGPSIYGCLDILGAQATGSVPVPRTDIGFAERCLLGDWSDTFGDLSATGSPAARFITLHARAYQVTLPLDQRVADLRALVALAPYAVGHQKKLCEQLIAQGAFDEARDVATRLRSQTWQHDMVDALFEQLDGR